MSLFTMPAFSLGNVKPLPCPCLLRSRETSLGDFICLVMRYRNAGPACNVSDCNKQNFRKLRESSSVCKVRKSPWCVLCINPLRNPIVATRTKLSHQIYDVTTASVFVRLGVLQKNSERAPVNALCLIYQSICLIPVSKHLLKQSQA